MTAIYKRELKAYFSNMIGYLFIAFMILMVGLFFCYNNLGSYGWPYFGSILGSVSFVMMLTVPVLTMRSFSDDRHSKADQLLLTAPVTVTEITLGKYLAMLTVLGIPMLIFCACPLIIGSVGTAYYFSDYVCILAFFLMGSAYIAIGMFMSSLTESQIISAVATLGVLVALYLIDGLTSFIPSTAQASALGFCALIILAVGIYYGMTKNWMAALIAGCLGIAAVGGLYFWNSDLFAGTLNDFLNSLSLDAQFMNFTNNVLDVKALVYMLSVCVVFVFLTIQSVQKRRWS